MVTYLYWIIALCIVGGSLFLVGIKLKQWTAALVLSGVLAIVFTSFYYFYLEQMFVKRWGGTMSVSVPAGFKHVTATWKDDNLWIENYDPKTNTCYFQEYSRGNMLEGKVVIKNCTPLHSQ